MGQHRKRYQSYQVNLPSVFSKLQMSSTRAYDSLSVDWLVFLGSNPTCIVIKVFHSTHPSRGS